MDEKILAGRNHAVRRDTSGEDTNAQNLPGESANVLELRDIRKKFGDTPVLNGLTLSVRTGEFITFLGPSGCGKTTALRIIAGLEIPDSGSVLLEGMDVTALPPERRGVHTVFQNYALFPHMNVFRNIAYSLKLRRTDKAETAQRVTEMLRLVQLEGFEKRMPSELSGGQRQRVAIARALINRPRVLLLDEPLGALDLQLRRQMQTELKRLQKKLNTTFLYVTHDQEEAINMSDRIILLRNGVIEQAGTPADVYDRPRTSYVARFIGAANILTGTVVSVTNGIAVAECPDGRFLCRTDAVKDGDLLKIAIRGESISLHRKPPSNAVLTGTVKENTFAGGMLRISVQLGNDTEVIVTRQGIHFDFSPGETVYLTWTPSAAVPVDREETDGMHDEKREQHET